MNTQDRKVMNAFQASMRASPEIQGCWDVTGETDYLLETANRYFTRQLTRDDIAWSYAGIRPLYDDQAGSASAVTRDYVLDLDGGDGRAPMLSIFGGKITTYRKLAEHALSSLEKGQRVIVTGRFRVKQWESGGKSGSAAEIDADGLGPDLMFGTTTFHRSAAPAEAGPAPATDAWATATPGESGGPGVAASTALNEPSATPSEVPAPSAAPDGQQERELVPAGAWTPPMEDTTPF